MNSILLKKLTELKKKELINKNEQQIVETKIKKMKKQNGLEDINNLKLQNGLEDINNLKLQNGLEDINNLKLQMDIFENNITGSILPNNNYIVEWQNEKDFNLDQVNINKLKGTISDEDFHKKKAELINRKMRNTGNKINQRYSNETTNNITVKDFISNLDLVDGETKGTFIKNKKYDINGWLSGLSMKEMVEIPHKIKIYNDIIPIFKSIITIIEKQKLEIIILKKKINSQ
jgi:hypothetical protein